MTFTKTNQSIPQSPVTAGTLPFERLDAWKLAIQLVELTAGLDLPRGVGHIADQLKRAASSVALNIAEACGKEGQDRKRFFLIARGSALESAAALKVLAALRVANSSKRDAAYQLCHRLYAILTKLGRG